MKKIKPEIGMVATRQQWTDRDVYIVTDISPSKKTITLSSAEFVDGMWQVEDSPWIFKAREKRKGDWRALKGDHGGSGGPNSLPFPFTLAVANPYRDPSF